MEVETISAKGDASEALSSKTSKRKRSFSKNSSDEETGSDGGEYELFTKYFVSNTEKTRSKSYTSQPLQKSPTRKRKFVYKSDSIVPKKCRRYYFLNEHMTKPRRAKNIKPPEPEEKLRAVTGKRHKLHFAKADANGNVLLMHKSYVKSDLFFNDEKSCNYETSKKQDISFYIVDEIALEGLDGITLEAFWKRLKNVFPNYISKAVADRLWRMICNNKHINFYILKEPREKLIAFDRCKYMDIDSGDFVDPFIEFKDIYPLSSINGTGVRGSCSTYHTRKENNGVRKFSMEKAIKLYDQRLVFVADQTLRSKALINEETDPNLELLDLEYCMLERIGRSRDQGELTQGKMSLNSTLNDSKSVYHNRKVLTQNFLIVNQFFYIKSANLQQNMSGGLVHLSRFYNKRRTKQIVIMEQVANILRERPNYQIELREFRKIFGRNRSIIKLLKTADFRRFFKTYTYPYSKLYPNAPKHEYLQKSGYKERQIKILRMVDPLANVTAILEAKDVKEVLPEKTKSDSVGQKLMNYEYLRDIFLYILSTGKVGVTIQEIYDHFKMDFYSVRMAVRKLLLRNVIDNHKIDLGRQQSLKFFAKCYNTPDCYIETNPSIPELTPETVAFALKGYEKVDSSVKFYSEPEKNNAVVPVQAHFTLNFEPFCCTAFLTETVDATSEELTIFDIVIKGRDKLLLIQSNLFAHYVSEWDDYLLKRDDFSKNSHLFQSGFGKIIYDYLSTVRINESIEVDNCIVFDIDSVTADTKIARPFLGHRIIEIDTNLSNPHSDGAYIDTVGKVYLFEAMFNETHNNHTIERIKNVYDRIMGSEGKKKREEVSVSKTESKIRVEVANNVVMEKFMGPNPCLKWSEFSEDGIKIDIYASSEPDRFVPHGALYTSNDVNFTQRYINRANSILKTVYEQTIVKDVATLFKFIRNEEDQEGYDKKVCKKSINSIILKLVTEGYIKVLKVVLTGKNMMRTQSFVCAPHIDVEHSLIRSSVDQLKLKFCVSTTQSNSKTVKVKKSAESPFSIGDVKDSIKELKQLTNSKIDSTLKFNKNFGKIYGYSPKFVKIRVLHEFLFYVVRDLRATECLNNKEIFDICKRLKIKTTANDITELPPVYCREISWKMFIPPLPKHTNFPKGWALACDIVLRMPLSVFVKIYNISYEIPELETHLKHPIKRHLLLKYLPLSIRNIIFHRRKYFHSIYEIMCYMCYIGLLQLGPRSYKEKDQLFMYLNQRASLYDTCTSKPGYNKIEKKKYKKLTFEFKTGSDVEVYWSEILRICLNTPLGRRKILDGHCVVIEDCNTKPEMLATVKPKTFQGAVEDDDGKIPGDKRGAAGFDSSLWSFLKRNWIWNSQKGGKTSNIQSQVTGLKKEKLDTALPQPIQYDLLAKGGPPERKVYLKPIKKMKKPSVQSVIVKKTSKKKFVRKIIAPRTKRVREYYDAIDKVIMKSNTQMRVDWDEEEDQLLRYCRAASVFLCPVAKKQFIPYNVIRDVLHRLNPKSKNKTSRAVQRRIYLLLMSDEIVKIMEANVENFLNSDTIAKYFDQIHNRHKYDIKVTDSQVYISFVYLMAYIYKHRKEIELLLLGYVATVDFFSDPYISLFEVILQNVEDESAVSLYPAPKTVEDITKDTIKSVIHCSMACKKNSTGWAFHLFHIYQKFPDDLIRTAVAEMKKGQFLVINKNYEEKSAANSWHTPLKFSHLYNVLKTSTYTIAMYLEAYRNFLDVVARGLSKTSNFMSYNELISFWEKVSFVFEVPEMGIILNPEIEDHSEVIDELSKRFRLYLIKIHERMTGSKNRNKDDLVPLEDKKGIVKDPENNIEDIKNDVRNLIFRVPYLLEKDLEINFKKMMESSSNLEVNNYIYLMFVDLKKFAEDNSVENLRNFVQNIEEVGDQNRLMKNLSKVVFAIQNIQYQKLGIRTDNCDSYEEKFRLWETERMEEFGSENVEETDNRRSRFNKNYTSGMEVCIKRAHEGDFPSLEEIKEGMMAEDEDVEDRRIPHITDLIMLLTEGRFPELDTDNATIEKMKEHFVMQYPKLQEFIVEDTDQFVNTAEVKNLNDSININQIRKAVDNIVKQPEIEKLTTYPSYVEEATDAGFINELIDFIKSKQEFGVSARELKGKFSDKNLAEALEFLTDIGILLRTGISCIVYVYHEYQSQWLTETFMLTSKEKEVFESKEKEEMKKLKTFIQEKLKCSDSLKVQLRPWSKLDGSINEDVFDEWMCIILSYCVDFPNIPFLSLCHRFHYFKPVDIYILLEILQGLGCIDIYLYSSIDHGLLSGREIITECRATSLDDFNDMFVKPKNVSGLYFGSFLDKSIFDLYV